MEQDKKLEYDSDVMICEEIPETIIVPSSPDTPNKPKTKKHKRKVKRSVRSVNHNNNMETLLITQKLQVKKTKFKCVININTINTIFRKRSDSIVRFERIVCKKEAYYHRILPMCLRKTCFHDKNGISRRCCRSPASKVFNKENAKDGLSPVSSAALTDIFECNNISYEDISNGSLSSDSEELDTLIQRTKQRERKLDHSYTPRHHVSTSTPISKFQGIASPFSIDTDKTIHSDTTMILNPLSNEAYSPTPSLEFSNIDNIKRSTNGDDYEIDIDVPYSPTMTPDPIKIDNLDYNTKGSANYSCNDDNNTAYSPTYTLESITLENIDYDSIMDHRNTYNDISAPYSPIFTPDFIKNEIFDDITRSVSNTRDDPYSPTITPDLFKIENSHKYETKMEAHVNGNVAYSPRSPTMTPDFIRMKNFNKPKVKMENANNNITNPVKITSELIKAEKLDNEPTISNNTPNFAVLTSDLIKREIVQNHRNSNCDGATEFIGNDYNMNNKIHCKREANGDQKGIKSFSQAGASDILVKIEKY